jgi:hypothetical protein
LINTSQSPTENILLLQHIPTLVELHTTSTADDILRLMVPSESDSRHAIICPELRTLHLLVTGRPQHNAADAVAPQQSAMSSTISLFARLVRREDNAALPRGAGPPAARD